MSKEIFQRFKRNAAIIIGSRLIFGILNILSSMIVVRFFGLAELGIVILLHSYTRLFNDIIKFDSWQAVLTYGSKFHETNDKVEQKKLFGLLITIDLVSISIGVICAIAFVPYAIDIFEWPEQVAKFAPFYAIAIFFMAHASPNGILRLFDRVDALAIEFALRATVKFIGVCLTAYLGGSAFHLVLTWFAAAVISGTWPLLICVKELHQRGQLPSLQFNWRKLSRRFPGIWRFLAFANMASSVGFLYTTGTVLFLGTTLGAAQAAVVEIAYQFTGALSRPIRILGPIIMPEFTKLVANNDWVTFRKIITQQLKVTGILILLIGLPLLLAFSFVLNTIYGPEVLEYVWLFRFLLLFVFLKILAFTFDPAILAANKPGMLLIIRAVTALIYVITALSLLNQYGIASVGFAAMLGQIFYIAIVVGFGKKLLKKRVVRHKILPDHK